MCEKAVRPPKTHHVKAITKYFTPFAHRDTTVSLRLNDRDYRVGDTFVMHEYNPSLEIFTGDEIVSTIKDILEAHEGLTPGWYLLVLDMPTANIRRFVPENCGRKEPFPIE